MPASEGTVREEAKLLRGFASSMVLISKIVYCHRAVGASLPL